MTTKVQLFYDKIMNDPDIIPPAGKKKEDIALAIAEQRVKQSENNNKALNMAKSKSSISDFINFIQLEKAKDFNIDTFIKDLQKVHSWDNEKSSDVKTKASSFHKKYEPHKDFIEGMIEAPGFFDDISEYLKNLDSAARGEPKKEVADQIVNKFNKDIDSYVLVDDGVEVFDKYQAYKIKTDPDYVPAPDRRIEIFNKQHGLSGNDAITEADEWTPQDFDSANYFMNNGNSDIDNLKMYKNVREDIQRELDAQIPLSIRSLYDIAVRDVGNDYMIGSTDNVESGQEPTSEETTVPPATEGDAGSQTGESEQGFTDTEIADDQAAQDAFNAARERAARSSGRRSSYVLPATTPTLNANHIGNFLNKLSSYQAGLFGEDTNLDMDEAELQNFFDRLSEEPSNPQEVRTKLNTAAANRLYNHFKETAETLGLTEGDDPQVTIPTEEEFINSFVNRDRENPINPKFLSDLRTVYLKNRAEVRQAAGIPPIAEQIDMFNPPQNNEQQSFIEEGGDTEGEVTEEVNTDVTEVVPTGEGSIETETTDTTEGGTTEEGLAGEETGVVDDVTEVVEPSASTTESSLESKLELSNQVSNKRNEINERGEREYVDPDDLPAAERSSGSPKRTYEKLHPEELPLINEWLGLKGDNQLTVDDDLTHDHLEHLDEWLNNDAHGHDEGMAFFRDPTKRNRFNSELS